MPPVKIEVRKSWPPTVQQKLIDAVHGAMIDALKVPTHDRQIRYIEHRPEHFAVSPVATENYTLVEIAMFSGRSNWLAGGWTLAAVMLLYVVRKPHEGKMMLELFSDEYRAHRQRTGGVVPRRHA